MQIVIDVDDNLYTRLFDNGEVDAVDMLKVCVAVRKGVVIPKGHGDLIDRSKIYKAIPAEEDNLTGAGMTFEEMDAYNDGIDHMFELVENAKPIIKADKGE